MKLKRATSALAAAGLGGWGSLALAVGDMPGGPKVNQLNLHEPVTQVMAQVYWLNSFVMWVCLAIFVLVFGAMSWAIWKHRKSKGYQAATFHESTAVEITWTIVPFLIIIALALPATKMVIEQKDTSSADVTIKATGYQWRWGYDYLNGEGEGISFLSTLSTPREQIENRAPKSDTYLMEVDNPVVVPVNRKVRIVLTADDVVHAWYIPAFGVKQDAIPGFIRDIWFRAEKIGIYRGQCAELCGKDHAFMPIVVDVRSDEDYTKWVDEQKQAKLASLEDPNKVWTEAELEARGEKVFQANCVACHQANGKGIPGTFPALAGSPVVLGPHAAQVDVVLHGRPGTAMASFAQLSDADIAGVITYTRHSWGNDAKDALVQPSDIAAARKQ